MIRKILSRNLEAIVWTSALVWLALIDPMGGSHFTLCPLKNLGIEWCPGCGLGVAVSWALHGELVESFHRHVLGVPAILILGWRIAELLRNPGNTTLRHPFTIQQRNQYAQRDAVNADARGRRDGFRAGFDQGHE